MAPRQVGVVASRVLSAEMRGDVAGKCGRRWRWRWWRRRMRARWFRTLALNLSTLGARLPIRAELGRLGGRVAVDRGDVKAPSFNAIVV